jgi:alcohol dehydrogenase
VNWFARWSYRYPGRLHVGRGTRDVLEREAGERWLVVASRRGRAQAEADPLLGRLLATRASVWIDDVRSNPDRAWLEQATSRVRSRAHDLTTVVGFGGGSALDATKVIAALLATGPDTPLAALLDDASSLADTRPLPVVAVATTAGTGSEVTPFATVWDLETKRKFSLASDRVWPALAVVDADLMDDLPREVTLATGLDAINQAAESVWNRNATPVTLELAGRALAVGLPALERLTTDDVRGGAVAAEYRGTAHVRRTAREALAEASVLAGLAISQTRTALCHSMSYPLTAHHGVPHGIACAFTMPAVARHVMAGEDGRLAQLARRAYGSEADAADLARGFTELVERTGVRSWVRDAVGSRHALRALLSEMTTPGRAGNSIVPADDASLERIAMEAWDGYEA